MNKIYLSSLILLLSISLTAQSSQQKKLDSLSQVIRNSCEIPGLAIGVIMDNQVYYTQALGVQSLNSKTPLSNASLFHMASVSKPFVATAILQLVESGKLKLKDKVVDHLPYFVMKDPNFKNITIKQVLNHTSGIPDVEDYEWKKPQIDDGAAERYTKSFTTAALDFKPGEEFSYSNAAFDIMADLIAKTSGLTFEAYMHKHIFEPAGMINSTFYKPEVPKEIATEPHTLGDDLQMKVQDFYPYNRIHAPSSTLHSNIEDMSRWALLYLNKGTIDGKQVFSETIYEQLTTPTYKVGKNVDICLGWFKQEIDGEPFYYHSGGDEGYRTFFGFLPERKAAIMLMGNSNYLETGKVTRLLIDQLIRKKQEAWKKRINFDLKNIILTHGIDSCKAFYHQAKTQMADQYNFRSGLIDELGYWLLDRGKHQEALDIFLFNVELLPKHAGFHDSVGDAYMAMGDKAKAIEWYKKALVLNPEQDFTIKKLKELE